MNLTRPRIEYYAWRHLPFGSFQGLNILVTLFDTLTRIPNNVSEPFVARQKLAFFQLDLAHIATHTAQHPDVQALDTLLQTNLLNLTPFDDLFTALETDIDRVQSLDDKDLDRYCKRKRGSFLLLCGALLKKAPLTEHEATQLQRIGVFIERTLLLQQRAAHPEKIHLFPIKDFSLPDYITYTRTFFDNTRCIDALRPLQLLASLYHDLLNALTTLPEHPDTVVTLTPLHLLMRSLYYRFIQGF